MMMKLSKYAHYQLVTDIENYIFVILIKWYFTKILADRFSYVIFSRSKLSLPFIYKYIAIRQYF